ncbi:hypothetical protein LEP1GSC050_2432 [Leptospira broomii serovar Hurstbridge str. 5399]|uniref:Uncharacterized protein n=1 Tax=Leptospira broomii serovar Hurstbridge str. 5399 TaxID=1049789 RepID=T0F3W7_9LEPT|nr:hypothetical protein LEP1GSC050_2432 [Leptospira broomii serovar Hurstbridge str. 5399]
MGKKTISIFPRRKIYEFAINRICEGSISAGLYYNHLIN